MQIYAIDDQEKLISVYTAKRKKNYRCLECKGSVRLKQGLFKQRHFFHLNTIPCRQREKSYYHLRFQLLLLDILPKGEAEMEYLFESLGRVADVIWHPKKIVFEIQCSILPEIEGKNRVYDYQLLGYTVVWLLSDKIFNKRKVTSVEKYLRTQPCYFIHVKSGISPFIYDQVEKFCGRQRIYKGPYFPVFLQDLHPLELTFDVDSIPKSLHYRLKHSFYFEGDLLFLTLQGRLESPFPPSYNKKWSLKNFYLRLLDRGLKIYSSHDHHSKTY